MFEERSRRSFFNACICGLLIWCAPLYGPSVARSCKYPMPFRARRVDAKLRSLTKAKAYNVLHLRAEIDWVLHCKRWEHLPDGEVAMRLQNSLGWEFTLGLLLPPSFPSLHLNTVSLRHLQGFICLRIPPWLRHCARQLHEQHGDRGRAAAHAWRECTGVWCAVGGHHLVQAVFFLYLSASQK